MFTLAGFSIEKLFWIGVVLIGILLFCVFFNFFINLSNIFTFFIKFWPFGLFILLHIFYFLHPAIDHIPFIFISNFSAIIVLLIAVVAYKFKIAKSVSLQTSIAINAILFAYEVSSSFIHLKALYSKKSILGLLYHLVHFNVYLFLFYIVWAVLVGYGFWLLLVRSNLLPAAINLLLELFRIKPKSIEIQPKQNSDFQEILPSNQEEKKNHI